MGDLGALQEIYTNREVPSSKQLAESLKELWQRAPSAPPSLPRAVYLSTDCINPEELASRLSEELGDIDVVVAADMFRTAHGSHSAAFAKQAVDGKIELSLPWEVTQLYVGDAQSRERVRRESFFDLFMLSGG